MSDTSTSSPNVRAKIPSFLAQNRIFMLLAAVSLAMAATTPHFASSGNLGAVLRGVSINALLAAGLTVVLIVRQLDLSFGAVLTLSAMIAASLYPRFGWGGAFAGALACGLAVGLVNGFLVTKAKVDSFIATLGTMIVLIGLSVRFSHGSTLSVKAPETIAWLETPLVGAPGSWLGLCLSPLTLTALGTVLSFEFFLKRTTVGRAFFLVGGNPKTAWYSGLPLAGLTTAAFAISGTLAGLAGAMTVAYSNTAQPGAGDPSLMVVIAAVIVGGTSMDGGRGSVFKSLVALVTLSMIENGFNLRGAGTEVIAIASGVVLGSVIVYDAVVWVRKQRIQGQRHELLAEVPALLARLHAPCDPSTESSTDSSSPSNTGESAMQPNNQNKSLLQLCMVALVAMAAVAIAGMYFIAQKSQVVVTSSGASNGVAAPATKPDEDAAVTFADVAPFIMKEETKVIPPRPANPAALPEDDAGHWYDKEYAGWNVEKINPIKSPGDGPKGKRVTYLGFVDHPYFTAYRSGLKAVAVHYGMELKEVCADNDVAKQTKQVDQVLVEKPDLVIINTVNADASAPLFKKMHDAGIPVIASNQLCSNDALAYAVCWCGPDDWGNFRALAREFATRMNNEGGYCIVRHFPGNSCDDSRTWSVVSELKKIAPKMECLAMEHSGLDKTKTEQLVSGWIGNFGSKVKGIVSADDSGAQLGINKACKDAGRTDIVRVAAGNSKVGADSIRSGELAACTAQPSECDGALAMELAVEWFAGKPLPKVRYLPKSIITKDNIDQFPAPKW